MIPPRLVAALLLVADVDAILGWTSNDTPVFIREEYVVWRACGAVGRGGRGGFGGAWCMLGMAGIMGMDGWYMGIGTCIAGFWCVTGAAERLLGRVFRALVDRPPVAGFLSGGVGVVYQLFKFFMYADVKAC